MFICFNNSVPIIFDVDEFYGPEILKFRIIQSFGPYSEEISRFSLEMKDILHAQESRLVKQEGLNR